MIVKAKPIIEYLTDYLDFLEIERGLSSKTQENYSRFLNKFFNWLVDNNFDKLKPEKLNEDHIWKYRVFLSRHVDPTLKKNLKKSTQNYYLIALRSLLEFFVEKKIASLSPSVIKLAKDKSDKEIKFLEINQLEKLLLSPDVKTKIGLRDRVILETLFSTGLRVAELVSLDREQVKINTGVSDLEISIIGKGEKVRTVYFSERVVKWLKLYLDKRNDIDVALFINYKQGIEKSGLPRRLTTKSIEDIVKKYVKISGVSILATPHTLRHSFATDLLSQGVDLRLVQEFLGHKNISTTQIYTHVTNKQLKDVHRKAHSGSRIKN
ncbi:MAG: Tyrosine recombinase xerD [Candidatus Falkowbacteria bacterium GW2011_GWC2_38_22]|uniref:Tyrosine recombinase xerD n=1 Tax=Candidatus Falkowbacteria bacterium GW2011_GWE1_38_31 TaxID=1618638 RepID=A0A0G0JWG8_9BACT|nr:MAG: Tyrosine recombinase xerD [Candidatus Falkowbacteria bacterium GW2011_GWF2_38_1205]KKQ62132.1 MAG: Tyrosine recombinase xerD [Candidatus Falkowbacteria bacterium GW2011_GWC2_38_22]KKQ64282.1 MAG: Tyrosine recombinase xerD [Candidatus Falkowbacteria bacterium GW2011_GWF1_38_22]KKQ66259.1 MAG: Tyrosine recombinase xerD [Candidatus Falkowbacteria bacterium GW2011_GWE2_38_254]KKQ70987.1 MAG: Tyrosine recombinase xerD [Candidatus Falkowbacteria bacterium GW2011_GWE1_38_31]KKQ73496.1 MAG: Ty